MSVTGTLTLSCGGCSREATVLLPRVSKRFHGSHGDWGIGRAIVEPVDFEALAPDGWVMFDPWTYVTYCPDCWKSITAEDERQEDR